MWPHFENGLVVDIFKALLFFWFVLILRKIVLFLVYMQFAKLYTHSAPSEIALQFPPPLRSKKLATARITFTLATKLKVFNSVVLDDPRKTVYKKVNRGSREADPSQIYFGWNGGKIQIWFVANFFTQEILFCYCLTS
jgi:hypothetical protein